MKSAKTLRNTADKERQKAQSLREEADKHRDTANSFKIDTDPSAPQRENEEAQRLEETAMRHEQNANDLIKEASELEARAVAIERQKQDRQAAAQKEIDRLDAEEKALRGE